MNKKFYLGILILILITVFGFIYYLSTGGLLDEKVVTESQEEQLTKIVKSIVSSNLKSPATAQYSNLIVRKTRSDEDKIIAFGDVDSQNSFGAMLRSHFDLWLKYKGGDIRDVGNWSVFSFTLNNILYVVNGKVVENPFDLSPNAVDMTLKTEASFRDSFFTEIKVKPRTVN